jgi:peptide/nickel transport system substrate-binding protein
MHRRTLLRLAASTAALASPALRRAAARDRTLRFVPTPDLTALDPMVVGNRATHTHAFLVFDTLYGVDANFQVRPQMAAGHSVDRDGLLWILRLRDGLTFHDGKPVLARDAVASIRRWATRDSFGQSLMDATAQMDAPDDHTLRIRLTRPFPLLPMALAGSTRTVPIIMPERIAQADPSKPVSEMVGSGPYRFLADVFDPGARAAYERHAAYVPRPDEPPSHTAGGKVAQFDRIEWVTMDAATAAAALTRGEVDWLEWPQPDQVPLLQRAPGVRLAVTEPPGSIGIMRLNHRIPPFDNKAIRQCALAAINQPECMTAIAGSGMWTANVGLFGPDNPLATTAGIDDTSSHQDPARLRQRLAEAGYRGEPLTILVIAGNSVIPLLSQVGADQLRRAGFMVDEKVMDIGTMLRRVQNPKPPAEGGWNVHFGIFDGVVNLTPVSNDYLRGDGRSGAPGWMVSPEMETLRAAFLAAATPDEQRRVTTQIQRRLFDDVPYIPLGSWVHQTALRTDLTSVTPGFPLFYGVTRI